MVLIWPFKKKVVIADQPKDPHKIVGVCMGWDFMPHLSFEDGTYLSTEAERIFHPEYFAHGGDWPRDPISGKMLPVADDCCMKRM